VTATRPGGNRWTWALGIGPILAVLTWLLARTDTIGVLGHDGAWLAVSGPRLSNLGAFLVAFVVLGIAPALLTRPVYGVAPHHLGLGVGDWRRGLPLLGVGIVAAALIGYRSAASPDLAAVYPLGSPTLAPGAFTLHVLGYGLYYASFEFEYRGFLLLGLRGHIGATQANLLQAGIATLAHLGKPHVELAAAFPASLIFGWLALRTRSIWYAFGIHWVVGVVLDYFLLAR
jgi:membrane protease YdiL (CAAX protease family)